VAEAEPEPAAGSPAAPVSARRQARLRRQLYRCEGNTPASEFLAALGDDGRVRRALGDCALAAQRFDQAVEHFTAALRHDERDRLAILGLARAHHQGGDPAAALPWYRRYLPLAPPRGARNARAAIAAIERGTGAGADPAD
jgi:tetratricopeptide (TPR) repeat protein